MTKPLLSIGMIFKNDVRCLERCLKSLQPLREAVPSELVMADTGSGDGSREIAAKYADILFDFPWVNDFSAARNAVMDRASGTWYLSIDADEWLMGDLDELLHFIREESEAQAGFVVQHNYADRALSGGYMDTQVLRLLRMDTGLRFHGAIHESWSLSARKAKLLGSTLFHHDGYAFNSPVEAAEKYRRNLDLLAPLLEKDPDDCRRMLQCMESAHLLPGENMAYAKRGMDLAERLKKRRPSPPDWLMFGPAIYRQAVWAAHHAGQDTLAMQWLALGEAAFPNSPYIQIDFAYFKTLRAYQEGDYEGVPAPGNEYFRALEKYRAGGYSISQTAPSTLYAVSPLCQEQIILQRADSLYRLGRIDEMRKVLEQFQPEDCIPDNLQIYIQLLAAAYRKGQDVSYIARKLAPLAAQSASENGKQKKLRNVLFLTVDELFSSITTVPSYPAFAEVGGDLGRAAAILESCDLGFIGEKLNQVENWEELPIAALLHALEFGADFPLPNKPLRLEEMDRLAARLAQHKERFFPLVLDAADRVDMDDWQGLCWARGLVLAAVQTYPWAGQDQDEKQGMALARAFAKTEGAFLPMCYNTECLQEERLFVLPPLHRLGWYCVRAFEALEQGGAVEYVRLLRVGLDTCEGMKHMVEFLADHTAEVQQLMAPPELKALAEQVRAILARFAPDDPAVAALKQSEAYQKVAYLIEGMEPPVMGGQLQ